MDKVLAVLLCLCILLPISKGCGTFYYPTKYTAAPGDIINITSPNYPNEYPNGVACHWLIEAAEPYSRLNYRFIGEFTLEDSYNCNGDNLKLYDSSTNTNGLGTYCSKNIPFPESTSTSGKYLFVVFTTNHAVGLPGFKMEITTNEDECAPFNFPTKYVLGPGQAVNITSPNYPNLYRNLQSCNWLIEAAPPYSRLNYRFIGQFAIEDSYNCNGDNLKLYDSSTNTNGLGTYCGTSNPFPESTSTSGRHLFVSFTTSRSGNLPGFKLEISTNEDACDPFNFPTKYVLGPGQAVNITSPNYPNLYRNLQSCNWLIEAAPPYSRLNYRFIGEFSVEESYNCNGDNLALYDSSTNTNKIGTYCGTNNPFPGSTSTSGRNLFVSFTTSRSGNLKGFKLEISTNEDECGSPHYPTKYVLGLGHGRGINISSPNYPNNYRNLQSCHWLIEAAPPYTKLKYRFVGKLSIESSYNCNADSVTLYDSATTSNRIGWHCYTSDEPRDSSITTNRFLYVAFTTNAAVAYEGFKLEITPIIDECGTWDSPTFVLGPGEAINITSPNYPLNYPNSKTCHWVVQAAQPYSKLNYRFIGQFSLEIDNQCLYDNVTLYDSSTKSNIIGSYCGRLLPAAGSTSGEYLYVNFNSNAGTASAGFTVEISTKDDECGTLDSPTKYVLGLGHAVNISSPNYPLNYPTDKTCHWLVEAAPPYSKLNYRFIGQFSLESHDQCLYDSVTLHDSSTTSNVIGSYCGRSPPNPGATTGRYLHVIFKSDDVTVSPGFRVEIAPTTN